MMDAHGRPGRVLLLGGTSEIGLAILRELPLAPGTEVILGGRDPERLAAAAADLPQPVTVVPYDATASTDHDALIAEIVAAGDLDLAICAAGILTPQDRLDAHPDEAATMVDTNLTGHIVTLLALARHLTHQGHGTLIVLSSVAAVRPRRANYVYGATTAGLDAFTRGLADSLTDTGVRVILVRPGFVIGRMTEGMTPAPLAVTAADVATAVADSYRRPASRGIDIVWVPRTLRALAVGMRLVPAPVWRRLRQ